MKKILFLIIIFTFSVSIVNAQTARTLEELINQYDQATSTELLNAFNNSITSEEEQILSTSPTHSFIVNPTLPPGFESLEELQQSIEESKNIDPSEQTEQTNVSSCFDHYSFGSVQAKLFTEIKDAISGSDLAINIEITNDNPYPVVDGAIFLKVYRELDDLSKRTIDGDDLIDQFWAVRDISLKAGEQKEYAIKWEIPAYIRDGNYHIDSYVVASDRYNLSGLTFTDDVSGSKTFINISGSEEGVYFDKSSVTKNGESHQFIASISLESETEPVIVSADIINNTNKDQEIELTWNLSWWDGLLPQNYLDQKIEKYTIPANSRKTVSYTVSDNEYSVYYLSPALKYEDTNSWLNIRFARQNKNIPRINFPAVNSYPLIENEPTTFFACLHNAGLDKYVDNTLYKAEIIDDKGNVIFEYQKEGKITGEMMVVEEQFTPKKDYSEFTIKSELYQDDVLIDSDEDYYSCEELNPEGCPKNNLSRQIIIGLILLMGIFILIRLIKKKND